MTNQMLKKVFLTSLLTFLACNPMPALHKEAEKTDPAFEWRGCMIDVSRHFFTIDFLERQIDVLSKMGINRLHLHLVDAGGWRMEIKAYPELTHRAAWRTESDWGKWWEGGMRNYATEGDKGAYGGYYTQEELRGLVRYAAERGVTIVPEIEMPGHSEEVLEIYPELRCTPIVRIIKNEGDQPYDYALEPPKASNTGDFCPSSSRVETFLKKVLDEVMDVFPSEYIHLGGDEAGKTAWSDCFVCEGKMQKLGTTDLGALQADFMNRMIAYVNSKGRRAVCWDEIVMDDSRQSQLTAAQGNIVMVWREPAYAKKAIARGFDVVMAPCNYCYLDYYQDAPPYQPHAAGGYLPVKKVYGFNPYDGLSAEEQKHVIGVQGNLWTEYIDTPAYAEYMLYPRIKAISEIGLYGNSRQPWEKFEKKVCKEVKSLKKKGYNAFDPSKAVGERPESLERENNLATGAKVTYAKPFHEKYAAAGTAALTDGWRGSWPHNDGRWQGFVSGKCLDATIDLGKPTTIKYIGMDFLQNSTAWIYLPKRLAFLVSSDGQDFRKIMEKENPRKKNAGVEFWKAEWQGTEQVRYIRVEGESTGEGEWIFTDEIVVR